jgi:integrase
MQNVELKAVLTGVRPGGCVQPYLARFGAELLSAGYTLLSARDHIRSAAHLGRWMESCNMGIDRLNKTAITRFARHHCECSGAGRRGQRPSPRTVARTRQFVEHLVRLGVVQPLAFPALKPLPSLLIGFRAWMNCQRGIKARTIDRYEWLIEKMLPMLGSNPVTYDASLVRRSLFRTVKDLSCSYAKTYVIALRAFLRFLAAQGRCRSHLDRAMPTVPEWRLSTGLRISEALSLQLDDLTPDGLLIRHTKFRKSRLVPLHVTVRQGIDRYLARRRQVAGHDGSLFISMGGTCLAYSTVCAVFLELTRSIGLRGAPGSRGPRIHDMRHTFAVSSLEACRDGKEDVARHVLALSTYLGHAQGLPVDLLQACIASCAAPHVGNAHPPGNP